MKINETISLEVLRQAEIDRAALRRTITLLRRELALTAFGVVKYRLGARDEQAVLNWRRRLALLETIELLIKLERG